MSIYDYLTPHDIVNFIPIDLWDDTKPPFDCKMLYVFLSRFCYETKIEYLTLTNDEIAYAIGFQAETVQQLLETLKERGYIKTEITFKGCEKNIKERRIYLNRSSKHVK